MIEVFLFGIVLGLIPITLAGLFVTAYLQYRRGDHPRRSNSDCCARY
nr:cytochrome B6/F complex subunit V [Ipomoea batatas]